jgi:hypothetical protein
MSARDHLPVAPDRNLSCGPARHGALDRGWTVGSRWRQRSEAASQDGRRREMARNYDVCVLAAAN